MTPLTLRPSRYDGPPTVEGLMAWFDTIQADQLRVLETNLTLAVAAGEINDVDGVERALAEARQEHVDAREQFRARVAAAVEGNRKIAGVGGHVAADDAASDEIVRQAAHLTVQLSTVFDALDRSLLEAIDMPATSEPVRVSLTAARATLRDAHNMLHSIITEIARSFADKRAQLLAAPKGS